MPHRTLMQMKICFYSEYWNSFLESIPALNGSSFISDSSDHHCSSLSVCHGVGCILATDTMTTSWESSCARSRCYLLHRVSSRIAREFYFYVL